VDLSLSQDGACTNLFENFRENSLKGVLSNDTTVTPPLFSLVNTFKGQKWKKLLNISKNCFFKKQFLEFRRRSNYEILSQSLAPTADC
jgi:hypothetical protein